MDEAENDRNIKLLNTEMSNLIGPLFRRHEASVIMTVMCNMTAAAAFACQLSHEQFCELMLILPPQYKSMWDEARDG
jgi:hypothetical protein